MKIEKPVKTDHPIHELLMRRWSPYSFSGEGVKPEDLKSMLEAARWAPSSYGEEPWRFLVARREDTESWQKMLSCLVEGNRVWAKNTGVLIITVVSENFKKNGKPNAAAEHDIGLAAMSLTVEAMHRGYAVHQMIGIENEKIRKEYEIPEGFHPLTAIAIGHAAPAEKLPEEMQDRDKERRPRTKLEEWVFGDKFGEKSKLV